jgi:formylglycine-generating enzyme required for sulfatase activity
MVLAARLLPLALLWVALACSATAHGAERKSLAVLDLVPEGMELKVHEIQLLTDFVRKVAIDEVGHEYDVMTRENMQVLLGAQGKTLEKCSEAKCEVEYGQMLGADVVVTGRLVNAFGRITVTIKSHDTASGKLQGADDREAGSRDALPEVVKAVSRSLITTYVRATPRPGATPPPSRRVQPTTPPPASDPDPDPDPEAKRWAQQDADLLEQIHRPKDHILIRAGTFKLGPSPGDPYSEPDETPQHQVQITRDFWLSTTEVTQAQWRKLMGNNPSKYASCGDDCPVEKVSFWDAIAYANARSRAERLAVCYPMRDCKGTPGKGHYSCKHIDFVGLGCSGYRLPTEAEWEYAARAGRTKATFKEWELDAVAWHKGNGGKKSHTVGTRKPNAWGLQDMLGSVWEWCWDWAGPYPSGRVKDPTGPSHGTERMGRGGSFTNDATQVRLTNREPDKPTVRFSNLGFRTARTRPSSAAGYPQPQGFSNKIAVAMAGEGTEFVMGSGSGGLGFKGTGTGGGGDGGYGRIHGMGNMDTGGGLGVRGGLGRKGDGSVGKMKIGSGASSGFCKKSNLKAVVRRRAGALRACYEARLQLNPKLKGKLIAQWVITEDGAVREAKIAGSLEDGKVKNCVLRVLRRMRFAKPEAGICRVRWPFVFAPGTPPQTPAPSTDKPAK